MSYYQDFKPYIGKQLTADELEQYTQLTKEKDRFRVSTVIGTNIVKAHCTVEGGKFLQIFMLEPYRGLHAMVRLDKGYFNDRNYAREYAVKELEIILKQIEYVRQFRSEYEAAQKEYFSLLTKLMIENNIVEESLYHHQNWFRTESLALQEQAYEEYKATLQRLIPNAGEDHIIHPLLLSQILRKI